MKNIIKNKSNNGFMDVAILLNSLKIKVYNDNRIMRNFKDVLGDIAKNWNEYTSDEKKSIGYAFSSCGDDK